MLRKRINKQPHPCSQGRGSHAKSRGSQNLTRALVPIRLLSLEGFHPGPLKGGPFSEVPTIRSKVTMRHVYAWGSRYFCGSSHVFRGPRVGSHSMTFLHCSRYTFSTGVMVRLGTFIGFMQCVSPAAVPGIVCLLHGPCRCICQCTSRLDGAEPSCPLPSKREMCSMAHRGTPRRLKGRWHRCALARSLAYQT